MLQGLIGEARLLGLEGEVTLRVGRDAPCLSVSRLEELWLYARAFVAKNMSTKSNPRGGIYAVAAYNMKITGPDCAVM